MVGQQAQHKLMNVYEHRILRKIKVPVCQDGRCRFGLLF